jgi:hypothetical protein
MTSSVMSMSSLLFVEVSVRTLLITIIHFYHKKDTVGEEEKEIEKKEKVGGFLLVLNFSLVGR